MGVPIMGLIELVFLRLVLWIGVPLALLIVALGPQRVNAWSRRFWGWLWTKRLDPEEILTQVVHMYEKRIAASRQALARSEAAEADIARNCQKSKENQTALESETRGYVCRGDDLGARAALYKLNLEKLAIQSFEEQLQRQRQHITEARRRLYLLELQLRQYEVGRSILLSQLAEARTVEQQYAIANNFDPFNAVAHWQEAEGLVHEKAVTAQALQQDYGDIAEMPLAGEPAHVDPTALDAQLAELKARYGQTNAGMRQPEIAQPGPNGSGRIESDKKS
jgi:phage shock protein A